MRRPIFDTPRNQRIAISLFFIAAACCCMSASAQQVSSLKEKPIHDEHTAPGKLLSQGHNEKPSGALRVVTYRLEEVTLPKALEIHSVESNIRIENALRLTVLLDDPVDDVYTIWIDDDGYPAVMTKKNELSCLIIGNRGLENNAPITVKRGVGCAIFARSTLPERLSVPKHLWRTDSLRAENFVSAIRRLPRSNAISTDAGVELELISSVPLPGRNEGIVLQIGEQEFEREPYRAARQVLRFRLSAEEFAQTRDGDVIKVKYGSCSLGGVRFGRLDKGALNH